MNDQFRKLLWQIAGSLNDTETAFCFISKLQDHTDDLVADLVEALEDDDDAVKAAAAFCLGHLWYVYGLEALDASSSIPKLLMLTDHHNPRMAFECTRAVAVLQVGGTIRLTEKQIEASYLRYIERGDRALKVEAASQLLAIEPQAGTYLAGMLDPETLQETLEDVRKRGVRQVLE